ncbi:MAG: uridylate kinase [Hyphomicrobiaceae bacterium]
MAHDQNDRRRLAPLVVKIGGSLLSNATRLSTVVATLARARRPIVIVPGGGPFADQVRDAQNSHGTSDRAAHRMALLAMHQTGLLIEDMQGRFIAVDTVAAIRQALAANRIPVWLPLRLAADDATLPVDWSVTSDALAARLAERLRFEAVLLIKSRCVPQGPSAAELASDSIVDTIFGHVVDRAGLAFRIIGPGEERALAEICLATPQMAVASLYVRRPCSRSDRSRRGVRRAMGGLSANPRH